MDMSLVDLSGITYLSSYSVEMSDLSEKQGAFDDKDYFVLEKKKDGATTTSRIHYANLSNALMEGIRTSPTVNLSGNRIFNNKLNTVYVDTIKLAKKYPNDNKIAVNLEYLHNVVEKIVYELSNQLYGKITQFLRLLGN